jgi:hypothetical protein
MRAGDLAVLFPLGTYRVRGFFQIASASAPTA